MKHNTDNFGWSDVGVVANRSQTNKPESLNNKIESLKSWLKNIWQMFLLTFVCPKTVLMEKYRKRDLHNKTLYSSNSAKVFVFWSQPSPIIIFVSKMLHSSVTRVQCWKLTLQLLVIS
jgi:hypothetical protein